MKYIIRVWPVFVLTLGVGLFAGSANSQTARTSKATQAVIQTAQVTLIDEVRVPANEAGVLAKLNVREGQFLKAGDEIGRSEDDKVRSALAKADFEYRIAHQKASNDVNVRFAAKLAEEKARLELLRYQLNPHFLLNAFTTLRGLVFSAPDAAGDMVAKLAEFCRFALTRTDQTGGTVADETKLIETYLATEKSRWWRLSSRVANSMSWSCMLMPSFSLSICDTTVAIFLCASEVL